MGGVTASTWGLAVAIVVVAFAPCTARAQSVTAATISGTVTDDAGEPVHDAIVTLVDGVSGVTRSTGSEQDGAFAFSLVPAGSYELKAEQLGFRPVRVTGIVARAGAHVMLQVTLAGAEPPVAEVDTTVGGASSGGAAVIPMAARGFGLDRLPVPERGALEALRFSTLGDPITGSVEGLPVTMNPIAIDGVLNRTASHPVLPSWRPDAVLPLAAVTSLELLSAPTDLEWAGFGGAVLHGLTARGTREFEAHAFGDWSGGIGAGSEYFDPGQVSPSAFRGGLTISGPIIRDTAHFLIGADVERGEVARPRAWVRSGADSAVRAAAQDGFGIDLDPYFGVRTAERRRASAFSRFDWALADRHHVAVWGGFATARTEEPAAGSGPVAPGSLADGSDLTVRGSVASTFSRAVGNEVHAGFDRASHEYTGAAIPATRIASLGAAFGTDAGLPGLFERTTVTLTDALHLTVGSSRIKFGLSGTLSRFARRHAFGSPGSFWFSDPAAFAAPAGVYRGTGGTPPAARFSTLQFGAFLQDTWSLAAGLDVTLGLRFDLHTLPQGEIARSNEWLERTGIANDSIAGHVQRLSPRFGFVWQVGGEGRWVVRGDAGSYSEEIAPDVFGELIAETGSSPVLYAVGALSDWPTLPGATDLGSRLTLLGPDFEAPRSSKASLALARLFADGGLVALDVRFRHTDFLPRRHDLNRLPAPSGTDQYGRPVYGTLEKVGGLVVAEAESNRRFSGFDLVSALDVDGYSDYWAFTARVRHPMGRFLGVAAAYTYSETRDNWLTGLHGGPYAQLTPFPDGLDGRDWAEARSDFDVPHRLAVGVEVRPLGRDGLTLAGMYRYRSGDPFTPGFPHGVDANGDGSVANDPAFVDDGIDGMDDLLARWDCLRPQLAGFAERNSCRDPSVQRLDLRVGLGPMTFGPYPVELWLELLNVTDTRMAVRDHALYTVDRSAGLVYDAATRETTVPLVANPNFGRPIAERSEGRALRFGLRVNY